MKRTGKVYLIGAGPGDIELLTRAWPRGLVESVTSAFDRAMADREEV